MPIYKGNAPIVGIYKGSTEIVRRYKGADLIYESAKWLPYSFSPFIMTTLPQTIDGLNVKDAQKITSLKGNSVAWNQLIDGIVNCRAGDRSAASGNGTLTFDSTTGIFTHTMGIPTANAYTNTVEMFGMSLRQGHKYLMRLFIKPAHSGNWYFRNFGSQTSLVANQWNDCSRIITMASDSTSEYLSPNTPQSQGYSQGDQNQFKIQLFDITLMFGPGSEPTSVLEFTRLFPNTYYAYDAGTLKSSQASALKTTGYNQFDGELEGGSIQQIDGQNTANAYAFRTKNYTRAIAGQTYTFENSLTQLGTLYLRYYDISYNYVGYETGTNANTQNITIPNNVAYIRAYWFRANTDWGTNPPSQSEAQICIHLTGKTGYEPYWTEAYQLPNAVLRSAGSVSDELSPDGTLTRRIGVVDLGTLSWENSESLATGLFSAVVSGMNTDTESAQRNKGIISSKYPVSTTLALNNNMNDKSMLKYSGSIFIRDSEFAGKTSAEVKSLLNGIMLYYELATMTTEQSTGFQEQTRIDPYGTMEMTTDIPQGIDSKLKCK